MPPRKKIGKVEKAVLTPEVAALAKKYGVKEDIWGNETETLAREIEEEDKLRSDSSYVLTNYGGELRSVLGLVHRKPPPEYQLYHLGEGGDFNEVATAISRRTQEDRMNAYFGEEDTWYDQSVRDQIEMSHVDGYHAPSKSTVSEFAPRVYKRLQYTEIKAVPETFHDAIEADDNAIAKFDILAIKDAQKRRAKVLQERFEQSDERKAMTKYTEKGTLLNDFNQTHLMTDLEKAMTFYKSIELESTFYDVYDDVPDAMY